MQILLICPSVFSNKKRPMQHLNSECVVGLQHFVLSFIKGVLQPLLQHLNKTAGVDVVCRPNKPQHWKTDHKKKKNIIYRLQF